jgi:dolichyl-phosphate beta-glucosyltransferase
MPKLSIIIPAYNEAKRIGVTLDSIADYAAACGYEIEVIVAVNNATDNTMELLAEYKAKMPYLVAMDLGMKHSLSGTKGWAVKQAVLASKGEYILYMDADNAVRISEIEKFWPFFGVKDSEKNAHADVVFGSRYTKGAHINRSWYRNILGRGSNLLVQAVLLPGIQDTQCGFKCFTRTAAQDVFSALYTWGWGFDMEVLALARKHGYSLKEVPVRWEEIGNSAVKGSAFITSLEELFKIRRMLGKQR